MKVLRLPSPISFTSVSLVPDTASDTALFCAPCKVTVFTLQDRTYSGMACPLLAIFRAEEVGSPVFPCNPLSVFAMFSDPDRTFPTRLLRWFGIAPDFPMPRTSVRNISRLNSMASTVTVYASYRHF